jgi:AAT family amino acid transporter
VFKNWTYPWGPWGVIILNSFLVLVQGWSCFSPHFDAVSFVSYYIELPVLLLMYVAWKLIKRTKVVSLDEMDLETDRYIREADPQAGEGRFDKGAAGKAKRILAWIF